MQSFDISQRAELAKVVAAEVQKKARLGAYSAALRLLGHIKAVVIPATPSEVTGAHPPVDRGLYRAAWATTRTDGGGDVYNPLPYAPIIEWGARAANIKIGKVMIDALTEWVLRKGLVSGKSKDAASEARGVAFAIANAMRKRGIFDGGKGLRVMERAMKKAPQFVREEIARELAR